MSDRRLTNDEHSYLALLVHTVDLCPATWPTLEVGVTIGAEELLESSASFPGVVMRDLARNVVQNVGLRDTMSSVGSDPAHETTKVTEEVAIKGGESTTGEGELWCAVVGKQRVGVLEERDQDEPVVDPTDVLAGYLTHREYTHHR